ncbi:hypothetical protein AMTR_s00017p00168960 [Amborella trichopoda]|uniref:Amidase domain-containing protein n=1 Tax=Amborella trichopoda TaxID=13333 RepID=W1PN51_AMBTC|nr:hypothetical protein AMTR_s00017p00168960 [Amborella trichopoda]
MISFNVILRIELILVAERGAYAFGVKCLDVFSMVTAYPIRNDALKYGELDYINGAALIRYQIAGNFLGLPAITVPIGYDKQGMPIGLQFIGRPWSEATLLHLAYAMQGLYSGSYQKPRVFYNLLSK